MAAAPDQSLRVMIVDDSAVIRGMLGRILETEPDVEVVGSFVNGEQAVKNANKVMPDLVLLDVEMPVMDGLTAIPKILEQWPDTNIVMCSSLTEKGASVSIKAMALGAVECLVKPSSVQDSGSSSDFKNLLLNLARVLRNKKLGKNSNESAVLSSTGPAVKAQAAHDKITLRNIPPAFQKPDIIMIGSSTGGPQALFEVLAHFKDSKVPIIITQHMPPTFTKILAEHVQQKTGIPTHEGEKGMVIKLGNIYIAPGGFHMVFRKESPISPIEIDLDDGPVVNFCKPAVDPMFQSALKVYGTRALGIILTGMGHDGINGARTLVEEGGCLIAQDEASSVVWGMPGAVATAGLCHAVMPLKEIGPWVRNKYF